MASGTSLRGLAIRLGVSAAHLSDIEHGRRRPSETLLRLIAHELRGVGADLDTLEGLVTGVDPDTRDWIASTPGVRKLLRTIQESGTHPADILSALEKVIAPKRTGRRRKAR